MRIQLDHHPSLSLTFLFSLSLAAGFITSTNPNPNPKRHFLRQFKPKSSSSATVSDLLSLLGSPQQASSVNACKARQLKSCFKFIVPFDPTREPGFGPDPGRRVLVSGIGGGIEEQNEAVWWPPLAVMELARIAVDSGGDVGAIQRTLDPTMIPVSLCCVYQDGGGFNSIYLMLLQCTLCIYLCI